MNDPSSLRPRVIGLGHRHPQPTPERDARSMMLVGELVWRDADAGDGSLTPRGQSTLAQFHDLLAQRRWPGRLRLFTGRFAPDPVKALAGGPLPWVSTDGNPDFTVGVWWSAEHIAAYARWCRAVAAAIADLPQITEVTVAGPTTEWSEPMIFQLEVDANRRCALDHGYSREGAEAALSAAIRVHAESMSPLGVASSLSANPYQFINDQGRFNSDITRALGFYDELRSAAGVGAVLMNNSLGASSSGDVRGKAYTALYAYLADAHRSGAQVAIQTMTPANMKRLGATLPDTLTYAVGTLGAASIEMPEGWETLLDVASAATWNAALASNAKA